MSISQTYRRQGFAVAPDRLPPSELAILQSAVDALLAEPVGAGAGFHDIDKGDDRRFLRHRHGDFPDLAALILGPRLGDLVRSLIDAPHLFNEQFVVKGPKTGASFAWHQDSAYVGFDHRPYLSVWIALDETTEANGCLYCLPRNLDTTPQIDPHAWDAAGKELVGYDGPEPGIALPCPAGTIVVFSSRTLHRSGANRTDAPRRAYLVQYSQGVITDPSTGKLRNFGTPLG